MRNPLPLRRSSWRDSLDARGFQDGMVLLLGVLLGLGLALALSVWVD